MQGLVRTLSFDIPVLNGEGKGVFVVEILSGDGVSVCKFVNYRHFPHHILGIVQSQAKCVSGIDRLLGNDFAGRGFDCTGELVFLKIRDLSCNIGKTNCSKDSEVM